MAYSYKAFPVKKGKFLPSHNVTKLGLPVLPLNELIYHGMDYTVEFVSIHGDTLYKCEGCGFNNCYEVIDDIEELKGYKFLVIRVYSQGGHVQIIMKKEDMFSAVHSVETSVVPAIQVKPRVVAVVCDEETDLWRYNYCPVLNPLNVCNFWKPKIVTDDFTLHSIERTMSMLALRFKKTKETAVEQSLSVTTPPVITEMPVHTPVIRLSGPIQSRPMSLSITAGQSLGKKRSQFDGNSVNCAIKAPTMIQGFGGPIQSRPMSSLTGQNCAISLTTGQGEEPLIKKRKVTYQRDGEPVYWKHQIENEGVEEVVDID